MKVVKATDYVLKLYTKNDLKRVPLKLQSKALRLEKCYSRGVQFLSLSLCVHIQIDFHFMFQIYHDNFIYKTPVSLFQERSSTCRAIPLPLLY